jgi:hypothetical protein
LFEQESPNEMYNYTYISLVELNSWTKLFKHLNPLKTLINLRHAHYKRLL